MDGARTINIHIDGEPEDLVHQLWEAYKEQAGPFTAKAERVVKGIWYAAYSTGMNTTVSIAGLEDTEKCMRMLERAREEIEAHYVMTAMESTRVDSKGDPHE